MIEITTNDGKEILRPMTRDTLALKVCDAIKAYIVSANLPPGSKLPSERKLSESLAVSRNVVREGLSVLVAEGVITKRPGKGVFLSQVGQRTLVQEGEDILEQELARYEAIREARAAVEVGAVGLIVSRVSAGELDQLEQSVVNLERKLETGGTFFKEDMQFHLTLLRAAHNDFLLQWSPLVEEVMRVWMHQRDSLAYTIKPLSLHEDAARVASEHRAILKAIRKRDVSEARALLKLHFRVPDL